MLVLLLWLFILPQGLFKDTVYSTVVESAEGELLGARIAADRQWRFPLERCRRGFRQPLYSSRTGGSGGIREWMCWPWDVHSGRMSAAGMW